VTESTNKTQRKRGPRLTARSSPREEAPFNPRRRRLYEIIFEADSQAGKAFDVLLLGAIVLSVVAVVVESIAEVRASWGLELLTLEWILTGLFTFEYGVRLMSVRRPRHYAWSFFGVVDLLAILPSYIGLFIGGAQSLMIIRVLRLLRVFRVFKLSRYLGEAATLMEALRNSRAKITVFLMAVLAIVFVMGSVMYLVEGPEHGFTSIPQGIYWAIVTLTTVGYGDIAPQTALGQAVASFVMVMGYGIIAVPTGIVTTELSRVSARGAARPSAKAAGTSGASAPSEEICASCGRSDHREDARFCRVCGEALGADGA
jgi:voltage-gated potassium channel